MLLKFMYLTIVFLPLIGSIIAGFFGFFIGRNGATRITILGMGCSFLLSLIIFYEVALNGSICYFNFLTWIESELFFCSWGFLFDTLTSVMLIVITCISTLVHIYSSEYMKEDPHLPRFMSYLSLFTFFMLILVTANNFIQLFVGWEGVGLCSYLLINFWFSRIQANKAAIKAMILNRVGDFGLTLGILVIFLTFKSVDYGVVFSLVPYFENSTFHFLNIELNVLNTIGILLFIGSIGKSAQLGLHTWLPDAMEGPTPVSALIHAATMVTAGNFLLARCSPIFEYAEFALNFISIIGVMTAFFAAVVGLLQNDLKRVIAYSTCSQLGYMVFACGIDTYSVGVFHLSNHAFFKALLFLGSGSIIHGMGDEQDMKKMGGLKNLMPFTYGMMVIGSLSLMGFPFLTGFYSKDVILELSYAKYTVNSHFIHWFGTISAFFTAFYSIRLIYLTFLTESNALKPIIFHAHDAPIRMTFPLGILAFGSIFIGYLTKDMIIGVGTSFWGNALFTLPKNLILLEAEFIPSHIKLVPVCFSVFGAFLSFVLYTFAYNFLFQIKTSFIGYKLYNFLNRKWFFDKIYQEFIGQQAIHFGYHKSYKLIDRGIIEMFGPYGLTQMVYANSLKLQRLQTGYISHYAFIILIGVTFLITFVGLFNFLSQCIDARLYLLFLFIILYKK